MNINWIIMLIKNFYIRNLPHLHIEYTHLFLTFRLVNSLPASLIEKLKMEYRREKNAILRSFKGEARDVMLYNQQKKYFGIFDRHLDTNMECINYLCEPKIAGMVRDSIHYRDGKDYDLNSYCIMPNHVHMVVYVKRFDKPFYRVTQSLKRYTATEANKIINRRGAFWHEETYDHVVRNQSEFDKINLYIMNNPFKAGLVKNPNDWKWRYCNHHQ